MPSLVPVACGRAATHYSYVGRDSSLPPCRSLCERVREGCLGQQQHPWPEDLDCSRLAEEDGCFGGMAVRRRRGEDPALMLEGLDAPSEAPYHRLYQVRICVSGGQPSFSLKLVFTCDEADRS